MELYDIAIHEAGHAVVSYLLGIEFTYIEVGHDDSYGGAGHVGPLYREPPRLEEDASSERFWAVAREVMAKLGGPAAGEIVLARDGRACRSDFWKPCEWLQPFCASFHEAELCRDWLYERTKLLLREPANRGTVETLANALLQEPASDGKRRLSGTSAREIVAAALRHASTGAKVNVTETGS